MSKEGIIALLGEYDKENVEAYAAYIMRLKLAKDKSGNIQNKWIQNRTPNELADLYKRVAKDGLVFDGVHITLQSTGISYDYIAYKNKMLLAYPDTQMDVQLVYKDDEFSVSNESGNIVYQHNIKDPLNQKEEDVKGGYCVIKNKRGEFLTLLSKEDIDKHRKVARTDYIWRQWFKEMALKTVIKKACKQHFADIYENIEKQDNENYDLENPLGLDIKLKQEIDAIDSKEELKKYYEKNKGKGKEFDQYITKRMGEYENS